MINKYSSFAHRSVTQGDRHSFRRASRLEKNIAHWAIDFSLNSERSMPWLEVKEIFIDAGIHGYVPSETELRAFIRASKIAHRMESSLRIEQMVDLLEFENTPIVLRIKFYYKNERKEFLEWKMTLGDTGRIYQASVTT